MENAETIVAEPAIAREDGKETKNFLTLDDPKKMAKEITWKYLNDVQHAYEIIFNQNDTVKVDPVFYKKNIL